MKATIGLVDDHQLFLKSLALLISQFGPYEIVIEALNGKDLVEKMKVKELIPDIMLIDVNMPQMNGVETVQWMQQHYPSCRLVALSMNDSDKSIISMIKAGCCAYLLKDTHPNELEKALNEIFEKGFYNADASNINYRRLLLAQNKMDNLTEKEKKFLELACSELTYKEIAVKMNLTARTIDGYRETLFEKLNVQSRVGMCLEALRREIVKLSQ
jgi:DNA-binding NarL/FixJ family response regulator